MAAEMGIFETIYNCRAMRKLDAREVPQEDLEKLIGAANQAPSGSNNQNARWIIVRNQEVKTKLAEQVDEYLSYSVTQWMDKNELAIEHGIKVEMAESVLAGLKQVFSENYIEISDEKVDLVDEMTEQLDVMEKKLNDQIEQNVTLVKELGGFTKNGIVSEVAEGLSLTQKEKLSSLAEAVEFEDESSYREKVTTLRESYFSTKPEVTSTELTEDVKVENQDVAPGMEAYVNALSRWSAKSN